MYVPHHFIVLSRSQNLSSKNTSVQLWCFAQDKPLVKYQMCIKL